jgi:hypothetical protein
VQLFIGKLDASYLLITTRASPATTGNREKQHVQPIRKKEKVRIRFYIVRPKAFESGKWKLKMLEATQAVFFRKSEMECM